MKLPGSNEYAPYYAQYVERVGSRDVLVALREQRGEMLELLYSLNDAQASYRYAPGKWSLKEVIGHLIDTERVFAYRGLCVGRGEQQGLPGFDQDDYVAAAAFDDRTLADLSRDYAVVRDATLTLFEGLTTEAWRRRGVASEAPFTVRAIAYVIAGHEVHHIAVLRERYLS